MNMTKLILTMSLAGFVSSAQAADDQTQRKERPQESSVKASQANKATGFGSGTGMGAGAGSGSASSMSGTGAGRGVGSGEGYGSNFSMPAGGTMPTGTTSPMPTGTTSTGTAPGY